MHKIDRTRQVAKLIKRELATLISRKLNDNRINSITITDVIISRDLKQSTVYVSSLDDRTSASKKEKLLNNTANYLRYLLSQQTNLRTTPSIIFKYDTLVQSGLKMTYLIDSLNKPFEQD